MPGERQCCNFNSSMGYSVRALNYLMLFALLLLTVTFNYVLPVQSIALHETEESLMQIAGHLDMFVDKLPKIPVLRGYTMKGHGSQYEPVNLTIGMYMKKWKFHRDLPPSTVFAYGKSKRQATVPGPTIMAMAGVKTYIRWLNHLPDEHIFSVDKTLLEDVNPKSGVPTVVHLHGGVSRPDSDGSALAWYTNGFKKKGEHWQTEVYTYENDKQLSNMWYHDHAMSYTRLNLLAGLVGAYKVVNPFQERKWKLPRKRFDRELVLMDKSFTNSGHIYINSTGNNPNIHPEWQPEYFGDVIIVNGKAWPYMKVQRRKYRFRIINSGNARFYRLALTNGMGFTQIGSDSFYLEKPVHMKQILIAPSEIADVIIDFSESNSSHVIMTNNAMYPFPDGDPVNEKNSKVMKFMVGERHLKDTAKIPLQLVNVEKLQMSMASNERNIVLYEFDTPDDEPTHLQINFMSYMDPVTELPKIGSTEIWKIINLTPDNHPLHVHLAAFQVVNQQKLKNVDEFSRCAAQNKGIENCNLKGYFDGEPEAPPLNEAGWKNVFKMQPYYVTTILVRFSLVDGQQFPFDPTVEPGYTYHCHILDHEDNVMMRPYRITP